MAAARELRPVEIVGLYEGQKEQLEVCAFAVVQQILVYVAAKIGSTVWAHAQKQVGAAHVTRAWFEH